MAINDPWDRSGQYAGGDIGPKLDNYSPLAPDRRDHAIGTMMGEGGPDTAAGYGGVLDVIENRISGAVKNHGQGAYGNFGQPSGDYTLEGMVKARNGAEFNAWSPRQRDAYGTTQRGLTGTPKPGREDGWYDQAQQVYDDYYHDPLSDYPGSAFGGTFYQNDALNLGKAGAFQRSMQREYGAMPIGSLGHVATGPGLDLSTAFSPKGSVNVASPDGLVGMSSSGVLGSAWSDDLTGGVLTGSDFGDLASPGWTDTIQEARFDPVSGFATRASYSMPSPSELKGWDATETFDAPAWDDQLGYDQLQGTAMTNRLGGTAYVDQLQPQTPGKPGAINQSMMQPGTTTIRDIYDPSAWGLSYDTGWTDAWGHPVDYETGMPVETGVVSPTHEDSSGNAQVGDGSYAEDAGYNDNDPQGIL